MRCLLLFNCSDYSIGNHQFRLEQTYPWQKLSEDNISGKLTDERFRKLSQDYEDEQSTLKKQVLLLCEEVEAAESKSANVDKFLSIVDRYTEIPELTPHILHEFVEKVVIHAATDPHSKVNRRQEVDIYSNHDWKRAREEIE